MATESRNGVEERALTLREAEIMNLLMQGLPNKDIALDCVAV